MGNSLSPAGLGRTIPDPPSAIGRPVLSTTGRGTLVSPELSPSNWLRWTNHWGPLSTEDTQDSPLSDPPKRERTRN